MAPRSPVVSFMISVFMIFFIAPRASGVSVHGLVGEPVQFPLPESCKADASATLSRVEQSVTRPVSSRVEGGVCKPAEKYKDRVELTSCFTFIRAHYTDSGVYELNCSDKPISLEVFYGTPVSLTEGERGRLPCYYTTRSTDQPPDSIRWRKDGQDVLVHSLVTGETKYGLDFENRVSLTSDWAETGNWSLIFDQVQPEDEGVYYCSAQRNGVSVARGSPAAVRMKVIRRNLNQTTPSPPINTTQSVPEERSWTLDGWTALLTAAVTFVIVASGFLLGWCLKTRCCPGDPPRAGSGRCTYTRGETSGNVSGEMVVSSA